MSESGNDLWREEAKYRLVICWLTVSFSRQPCEMAES